MAASSGESFTFPVYKINLGKVDKIRSLVRAIEDVRPSLGIPILAALAGRIGARYSTIGRGIIFFGEKGEGKGEIIEASNQKKVAENWEASNFLGKRFIKGAIKDARDNDIDISNISIVFEDLAMAAEDKYRLNNTLHLSSWLVSNKKYSDKSDFHKGFDEDGGAFNFKSVSFIAGSTPRTLHSIIRRKAWRDMWSDRLSRFALLTRAEDSHRIDRYEASGQDVSALDVREMISKRIPELPETISLAIGHEEIREADRLLFTNQHGPRRGRKYIINDLKGIAALQGDNEVTEDHLGILKLFAPYYQVGSWHPRDAMIIQTAINNPPHWNILSISQRTGLTDQWWIRDRILKAAQYDLLSFNFNPDRISHSTVSAGERLRIGFESIDSFINQD